MNHKPQFNPAYSVETIEPNKVFFLSERDPLCLSDRLSYSLATLVDGERNNDEIIDTIRQLLLPAQENIRDTNTIFQKVLDLSIKVQYALSQMEKQGYFIEQAAPLPSHLAIFCHHLNLASTVAYQRLQSTKVVVKALGSVAAENFIPMLESLQIQVADEGDLTIVLTDEYLHPELDEFNQQSLKSQSPWMLVKPLGKIVWIGPLFSPKQTGCWNCLAQRLRDDRLVEGFIQRQKDIAPPLGFLTSTVQTALGMAATEVFKWIIQGENKRLENNLIAYDMIALRTENHSLVKHLQCSSCGEMIPG